MSTEVMLMVHLTERFRKKAKYPEKDLFKKATLEVMKFEKPSLYEKISTKANAIFYYSSKILPTEIISAVCEMTVVMKDLPST